MRPQQLALRATNQYRTRDIMAYLGLRYYFANQCARRDLWADEVATHLVMSRSCGAYFQSRHFKDVRVDGQIVHRDIFLPGPNESFAEAALLAECSRYAAFRSPEFVFSYRLSEGEDTQGVYKPYFSGLQERQQKIAAACKAGADQVVRYTDIKRFYPSISGTLATEAWQKACDAAQLAPRFRELGLKLLSDYALAGKKSAHGNGLLTGPMLSHLIANLVLRNVDDVMSASFPNRYFRYVDDVVLVGSQAEVKRGRAQLAVLLNECELDLHDADTGKDFELATGDWMAGADDFSGDISQSWMFLARDLKQFLISQSSSRATLSAMFAAEGFRIPLPDYSVEVSDARYRDRFFDQLRRYPWLLRKIFRQTTPSMLISTARLLRSRYIESLNEVLAIGHDADGYARKRAIPKIRYLAGRLLYLAKPEDLPVIAERLRPYTELNMLAEVMHTVGTRDITRLLRMGGNAAQSAAQALKLTPDKITCHVQSWDSAERQGLAVLRANGITVDGPADDDLNRLVLWHESGHALMKSDELFIQEIACLHGVSTAPRHPEILETAFDPSEELAFDATTPIDTY
ncbi:RNA-directed DNA polymerase [Chromobacterium amazonense]|uniref:RNA-directed DNA polymerase n=1 Tax=Chromobacterium amazonense TaxID=1382803 RepID=UPI0021B83693|nr:RNA-directed DNA polymerase [Chromobacterium amazonense]MBM2882821.1 RNA-directed DNA polymerase [Chromobacterium amazonense]